MDRDALAPLGLNRKFRTRGEQLNPNPSSLNPKLQTPIQSLSLLQGHHYSVHVLPDSGGGARRGRHGYLFRAWDPQLPRGKYSGSTVILKESIDHQDE